MTTEKKPDALECEICHRAILVLDEDALWGDEIDWGTPWEQYICDDCHDAIWDGLFKSCCPRCETRPCERGRDCWINPWPRIMYLAYIAPRSPAPNGTREWFIRTDLTGFLSGAIA